MSYADHTLKFATRVEQARWWLEQAIAHKFGLHARDDRGIYPELPRELNDVIEQLEGWIDAKIADALATPESKP